MKITLNIHINEILISVNHDGIIGSVSVVVLILIGENFR